MTEYQYSYTGSLDEYDFGRYAYCHIVASAKSSATRARRLQEVRDHLEHNTGPQPRRSRAPRDARAD